MNSSLPLLGVLNILATTASQQSLQVLLHQIQTQAKFSTVVVLVNPKVPLANGAHSALIDNLQVPVLRVDVGRHYCLKKHFKNDFLAVVYLHPAVYKETLSALAEILDRIAQTKIVFISPGMRHLVRELFRDCWRKKMLNAVALMENTYFSYNPFLGMLLKEHSLGESREIFPNLLLNVHEQPFRFLVDGVEPRDYMYINRRGLRVLGGYTAHFLAAFAQKINATLTPMEPAAGEIAYHQDTDKLLDEDVIDIFGGLVIMLPPMRGQSEPAEVITLCIMIPVEPRVPQYLYYPKIFTSFPILMMFGMVLVFSLLIWCIFKVDGRRKLHRSEVIVNAKCVQALLSQPFNEYPHSSVKLRAIYFLSCALGLFFSSIYLATLNTLVTYPPSESLVSSFEDLRHARFKVFLYRPEYNEVRNMTDEYEKYTDSFEFTHNHTLFHLKRNSMDTRYGYSVPTNKWKTFAEQQRFFTTPLYRLSNLCLIPVLFMVFLLNRNSVYLDALNQLLLRSHQSGLYDHWVKMAFLELVEAHRMRLDVKTGDSGPKALTLGDMRWLWGLFGVLVAVNWAVLAAEICWFRYWNRK